MLKVYISYRRKRGERNQTKVPPCQLQSFSGASSSTSSLSRLPCSWLSLLLQLQVGIFLSCLSFTTQETRTYQAPNANPHLMPVRFHDMNRNANLAYTAAFTSMLQPLLDAFKFLCSLTRIFDCLGELRTSPRTSHDVSGLSYI